MKSNKAIRRKERRAKRHVQVLEKNYRFMKHLLKLEKERADLAIENQEKQARTTNMILQSQLLVDVHPDNVRRQAAVQLQYHRPEVVLPLPYRAVNTLANYMAIGDMEPLDRLHGYDYVRVEQFAIHAMRAFNYEAIISRSRRPGELEDWFFAIIRDTGEELAKHIVCRLLSDAAVLHLSRKGQ